jgi:cytochrome c biogenesis protein CcdA
VRYHPDGRATGIIAPCVRARCLCPVNRDCLAEVHSRRPDQGFTRVNRLFHYSRASLVATAWASAGFFGLYILAFYAAAMFDRTMTQWNQIAAGGVILVLGCIQLIQAVRSRFPVLHRWVGRVYVAASCLAPGARSAARSWIWVLPDMAS